MRKHKALKPTALERYHPNITFTDRLLQTELSVNYHISGVHM
jgi:hypothetical protein